MRETPERVKEILRQTEEKVQQGIVEKSNAPWSSNCVCINKNGKIRIAVDYRKLNEVTIKDNYLLPTIQECLDQLHDTRYFTSIDCAQAYHQIPLKTERDKDLTSFVVPGGGLYRYKYMPFGLCNAGAVWCRFIDEVLEGLRWNICLVYADDILIHTKSDKIEDHIADLNKVFDRLDKYNVKVRADKMRLALKELPFLGQLVGVNGCRPDPEKTKAVTELESPTTVHQLRRVMGMFAYYRKYIQNFARIAAPLYELTGKNAQNKRNSNKQIILSKAQKDSFDQLKIHLTTAPILLQFPDWNKEFEIHCDASDIGVAAVLWQHTEEKEMKVVMYASKMLAPTEKKYFAYEKEALALVWSLDLFRHYLRNKFKVVTDCRSLVYLKKHSNTSRIARWMLRLQEYDFIVKHRPGKLSNDCDGLTRQPLNSTTPYNETPTELLYGEEINFNTILGQAEQAIQTERANIRVVTTRRTKDLDKNKTDSKSGQLEPQKKVTVKKRKSPEKIVEQVEETKIEVQETKEVLEEREEERQYFKCEKELEGWEIQTWIDEQNNKKNEEMQDIIKTMHTSTNKVFKINDKNLIVRINKKEGQKDRVVVPNSLKAFVIGQHHNLPLHAHQGSKRLRQMIASRYFWPGMELDIQKWTNACTKCARRKTNRHINTGLTTAALAHEPWQVVGIDLVGPVLESGSKNKYILTIVDHFTRWPIAVAIPDKKGKTIAKALYEHFIAEHGIPEKVLSDQGKEFINEGMSILCNRWGIKQVVTGGYNPQANGACERYHRWMNTAMTQLYDRKSLDWDSYLPAISFAYRVSENDSTGYSPFFLNTGREPTLPSDITFRPDSKSEVSEDDYVSTMTNKLVKAFDLAICCTQRKHTKIT